MRAMPSGRIKVAVVSPHPLIHGGLSQMVEACEDLVEALPSASGELDADVVVFDATNVQTRSAVELDYLATLPSTALVAVVPPDQPGLADHMLARGAVGVVPLETSMRQLADVIVLAALEPRREPGRGAGELAYPQGLTRREVQVLSRIALGRTNHQVAAELNLSPNSIKSYVRSAYSKIGVNSRSQAVRWVLQSYAVSPAGRAGQADR